MKNKDFYKYTKIIDELIKAEKPSRKDLNILLSIIQDDKGLSIYFYDKNHNAEWATILDKAGEFNELGGETENEILKNESSLFSRSG